MSTTPIIHIITVEVFFEYEEGCEFELHERVYMSLEKARAAVKQIKKEKKSSMMFDRCIISIYEIQRNLTLNFVENDEFTRQQLQLQQQQRQQRQQRQQG
jgi:hypothetical protein